MKKILCLILVCIFAFPAAALAAARIPVYRVDDALLFFDKSTGEITGFAGEPAWLTIPAYIGGYKVNSIGERAFMGCNTLKKVTIDQGVSSIGAQAFYKCTNLYEAYIPGSVSSLGDSAFGECTSLRVVNFGGEIGTIALNAFDSTPWSSTGEFVIAGKTLLLKYCGGSENVVIPSGVRTIAPNAFAYNSNIKSVVIPEGVTQIGDNAFVHCYSLADISFPKTVSSIGLGAFDDTIWLRSKTEEFVSINGILIAYNGNGGCVSVPSGITSVADGVFMANEKIYAVYLPEGIKSIKEAAFGGNSRLEAVVVPNSVEYIDDYAFTGSKNVVLFASKGSYTEYYAMINSISFSAPIAVDVNGQGIYLDVAPVIIGGWAYIPMRAVMEAVGLNVKWNPSAKEATVYADNTAVSVTIGSKTAVVNGQEVQTEHEPIMLGERVLIPIKYFGEIFGFDVWWDGEARAVKINAWE